MNNKCIALALVNYSDLLELDSINEQIDLITSNIITANRLCETIDNYLYQQLVLTEGSKFETAKTVVKEAVKALIRKLKAVGQQLLATMKRLAKIDRIPDDGEFIDIDRAMTLLDNIKEDSEVPMHHYHTNDKINPNQLASLINKCNKMVNIIERELNSCSDYSLSNRRLRLIKNILSKSNELMKSLSKRKSVDINQTKERFKQKYKYDPKDRTILVDGERYRIRMSEDKDTQARGLVDKTTTSNHKFVGTSANLFNKRGGIYLDDNFWKLDSDSYRDAMLRHEIGHLKLHSYNAKSKHLDKELVSQRNVDKANSITMNKGSIINYDKMNNLRNKYKDSERNKVRSKNIEEYKKYEDRRVGHANIDEFEADRYAANITGDKALVDGLKNLYKIATKHGNDNSDQLIKEQARQLGLSEQETEELVRLSTKSSFARLNKFIGRLSQKYVGKIDTKARVKALKSDKIDKSIYNAKNESIIFNNQLRAQLLIEAANLLSKND